MSLPKPVARFTVVTLGVSDMRRSIAFYESLGFERKLRATGEEVAFFDTGATVVAPNFVKSLNFTISSIAAARRSHRAKSMRC